jgi:hypothetical protein
MRPGWRLIVPYLFLSVLWVGWFGYVISDSSRAISFADILIRQDRYERRSGLPPTSNATDWIAHQSAQRARQRTAEMAILAFPVLAPVLYFICVWIARGSRQAGQPGQTAQSDSGKAP